MLTAFDRGYVQSFAVDQQISCIASHWYYLESPFGRAELYMYHFFFSSRRRHTRSKRDWSSDVCSSDLRRGGPAELQRRVDAGELAPDFGPARLHETAGAVILGARRPLIAFNVNLRGTLAAARAIAAVVREKGGGFPGVRALGLDLPSAGLVQVSMNVEDWEASALHDIVERVAAEAELHGAEIVGSELVGLMP